jgi:hypothetical protein
MYSVGGRLNSRRLAAARISNGDRSLDAVAGHQPFIAGEFVKADHLAAIHVV